MSGRGDDSRYRHETSRSRSREGAYQRDDRRERSRDRDREDTHTRDRRDEGRRGRSRSPSLSPSRRRSRSPRRRSRSRSRDILRSRHDRRSRSRSRSPDKDRGKRKDRSQERRRRSRSRSVSTMSSSSSDRKHHRKKDKRHKRKRSKSRDRKKEKKDKKKKKTAAVGHQWGRYGIISETDMYSKESEFRAWLVEERIMNPETLSKEQTRKQFAQFVEDYNTATLPHEKFYDMTRYEARMTALRAGEYVPPADDTYDPNADMRALQSSQRDKRKAKDSTETYLTKEQLTELRKVQAERVEVGKMKLLGMDVKQTMGVRMDTMEE